MTRRSPGRITAMSLHDDPQTGARYVTMSYQRTEGGRRQRRHPPEFAPSQAIVTDYRIT